MSKGLRSDMSHGEVILSLGDATRLAEAGLCELLHRAQRSDPEIPQAVVGAVVSLFRREVPLE